MSLHFVLSVTNSLHMLTPSTWRSLFTSSLHPFLGLPLRLVPSSSWVKIFLGILSSSILSRWPSQLILCPFIHFTIFSPLFGSSSSWFVLIFHSPSSCLGQYILQICWVFINIAQHQLESCTGIIIQTGSGLICVNKFKDFKQYIYIRISVHSYNILFSNNYCIIASFHGLRVKVAHVWFNLHCAVTQFVIYSFVYKLRFHDKLQFHLYEKCRVTR